MTKEEMLHELTKDGDPEGTFCCPFCYTWYKTYAEKQHCETVRHGYEVIDLTPQDPETEH